MSRARSLALFLLLGLAGGLVGCASSGDESAKATSSSTSTTEALESTTTISAVSAEQICPSLQEISEFDARAEQFAATDDWPVGAEGDWPGTQRFLVENTPPVLVAYDRAIATGTDLADELVMMRDLTADTAGIAASSKDFLDMAMQLIGRPRIIEAADAGETLNSFAESTCGVSTGGFLVGGFSTENIGLGPPPDDGAGD